MLTIKRVPTVVSNYQEDSVDAAGCGRKCLGKCCLPVSKLPLYTFKPKDQAGDKVEQENSDPDFSFNSLLWGQWEDRMSRGLFRYDVTACETKVIPGEYGFIAQLNEGRHLKKRPTEFRVDKVLQPFDPNKFNFTKVGQEEVLFRFEENLDADEDDDDEQSALFIPKSSVLPSANPSVIAINVSPIEYGHVLLIPRVLDCLPQRMDDEGLFLALSMASEASNPFFRVGYNSLGAFATINHLHFQAYYLNVPFPVEKAPTKMVAEKTKNGVKIYELRKYPVRGLVFEGGRCLRNLSDEVFACCVWLQENNIPYNLLISDSGKRIFLFPQCYAEKQALGEVSQDLLDTQVNPAVWEISGHMVLKRKKDYEDASEDYAWKLIAKVSLSEERFEEVKDYLLEEAVHGFVIAEDPKEGEPFVNAVAETESEDLFEVHGGPCVHVAKGCLVQQ